MYTVLTLSVLLGIGGFSGSEMHLIHGTYHSLCVAATVFVFALAASVAVWALAEEKDVVRGYFE